MKTKRGTNGQAVVSTKDVVRFTEKPEETVKVNARKEGREEGKREEDDRNNEVSEARSRSEVAKTRNRAGEERERESPKGGLCNNLRPPHII